MPGWERSDSLSDEVRDVAGYRLLRCVGEGGMSRVYLSFDVAAGTTVAVKLLADHLAHSREFVGRFYREARLSRLLSHRNIVRGLGAGYDPAASKHYLILEYIDGPTAQSILSRDGKLPIGIAVQVGIDIARALAFLHSRQYVHRDIKPDNILFHPDGIAKLADLGLAKRHNDDPQLTATHNGVGTSYYMAYEQALNADLVDGRSDIFALGATLYHLLSGQVPFPGGSHEEVIRGKERDTFRPLQEMNPEIPGSLADLITSTLARDPRARIQTAAELAAALEATLLARPIPSFAAADQAGIGTDTPQDAPTRADIPLLDVQQPADPGPLNPPTAAPTSGGLPQICRPTHWLPFRTGLGMLAVAMAGGVLAAATGFFSTGSPGNSPPLDSQPAATSGASDSSPDGLPPAPTQ
jgi:serine/threonine-protein kinase